MELLQLKYFCSAAITMNFSKTAELFLVPQSAVSQSVKRLEKELGRELFLRKVNKIELNEFGKEFYNHICNALNEIDAGVRSVSDEKGIVRGNISVLIKTNRRYITDCIGKFKALYPLAEFTLYHESADYNTGNFDIIIDEQPPAHGEYEKKLLITERINIGVSRQHRLASKGSVSVSELENENFISMTKGASLYRVFENLCYRAGIRPYVSIFCDDPYYVRKYASMNLGIALIPEISWAGVTENLVVLPIKDMELRRNTYIFIKKNIDENSIVNLFKRFLMKNKNHK